MASPHICYLWLLFEIPAQTPLLSSLLILISSILPLLLSPHLLLQILSLYLPRILPLSHILIILLLDLLICSSFKYLLILPAYKIAPTEFVPQLPLLSSLSLYIINILLQNQKPLMWSHQTPIALLPLCLLLFLFLLVLLTLQFAPRVAL